MTRIILLSLIILSSCSNDVKFNKANKRMLNEDYQKAIKKYTKVIINEPDYHEALHNRGVCYLKIEELEKSIEDLTKATNLFPNDVYFFNLALAQIKNQEIDNALNSLNQIQNESNEIDKEELYLQKGNVLFRLGRYNQSLLEYNKIDNAKNIMLIKGINLYHTKEYENSYKTLKNYELNNKSQNEIYIYLGSCALYLKEFENAINYFEIYLNKEKNLPNQFTKEYSQSYSFQANKLYLENKRKNALTAYTKSLNIDNKNADAYYGRGVLYYENGMIPEALKDFQEASKNGSLKAINYVNLLTK